MDVLILTLFVTLVLVAGAVLLLVRSIRQGDLEHGDRLSLLPLEEDLPGEGANDPGDAPDRGARREPEPRAS